MEVLDNDGRQLVDRQLEDWRQGDYVLGEHWFLFRTNTERPLTDAGAVAAGGGVENAEAAVRGFVVVTQTCDIVRGCSGRPFIEVSPLVEVEAYVLQDVKRGRRPNYAFIPGVVQKLVADLDRVMTVEKSVVARWERGQGCLSNDDTRRLSLALARKRARMAFPDDFVAFVSPLMKRMSSKHDKKESPEGKALRALREIRVQAAPSWDATKVTLMFWFIRNEDEPTFENRGWDHYLSDWLGRVPKKDRFINVEGVVTTLDDLKARDYVESDPLDLDHLSSREG